MRALDTSALNTSALNTSALAQTAIQPASPGVRNVTPRPDVSPESIADLLATRTGRIPLNRWNEALPILTVEAERHSSNGQSFESFGLGLGLELFRRWDPSQSTDWAAAMQTTIKHLGLLLVPGGPIYLLLAADPQVTANLAQLVLGFLNGAADSGLVSSQALRDYVEVTVATTTILPLYGICFLLGAGYQIIMNWVDMFNLVYSILPNLPVFLDLIPLVPTIAEQLLAYIRQKQSGAALHDVGYNSGLAMGQSMRQDLAPKIDFTTAPLATILEQMVTWSFTMGTYLGELFLDLLLSITGVGLGAVALKWLGRGVKIASSVIGWLTDWLKSLLDFIDPKIVGLLLNAASDLAAMINDMVSHIVKLMSRHSGIEEAPLQSGFDAMRKTLDEEEFRHVLDDLVCDWSPVR